MELTSAAVPKSREEPGLPPDAVLWLSTGMLMFAVEGEAPEEGGEAGVDAEEGELEVLALLVRLALSALRPNPMVLDTPRKRI